MIRTITRRQSKNAAAYDKIVQQVQEQKQAKSKDPDVIAKDAPPPKPLHVFTEVCALYPIYREILCRQLKR